NNGAVLSLDHVTMTNNQAAGAYEGAGGAIGNAFGASLTATDCTFSGNVASGVGLGGAGGVLYNTDNSIAVFAHSTFTGNQATAGQLSVAGAILNAAGSQLTVSDSSFDNNQSMAAGQARGGAIDTEYFGLFAGLPATTTIGQCSFTGNQAVGGNGS